MSRRPNWWPGCVRCSRAISIKQFADVEVYQLASGGIAGAEGAVTLAIKGMPEQVEKAMMAVAEVYGEPLF